MLVSMTGFGQAEASNRYGSVAVEVRTVNHRYLDLAVKLPKALSAHEHEIKDLIKDRLRRGRITITATSNGEEPEYEVRLNMELLEQYLKQLRRFAREHKLSGELDINTLAGLPEVFQVVERVRDSEKLWQLLKTAIRQAVDQCLRMRQREGRLLEADIRKRLRAMNRVIKKVEARAPKVVDHHNQQLKARVEKILNGSRIEHERWMTEVALLVDRLDFTEEIIRLKAHMSQMTECLDEGGAVSKKLTYLLQEVHREATTIGSKASDATVSEHVVALKEESERLREQVQNIE